MKNVLFVDDEPRVLLGMRRMLHGMRGEWNMVFAEGGVAALAELAKTAFDVVVTDMRMPEIDGNQLLARVERQSPSTVRIILSGHTDPEAALQAVALAHGFLAKPCDAQTLKDTVSRSIALQESLLDTRLRGVIGSLGAIPTLPGVYQELTRVLRDPDASIAECAEVVRRDALVTAKLLHLVNSAFFGIAQRVATVEHALNYLGAKTVQRLVLNVELFERTSIDAARSLVDPRAEQRHSLAVGELARRIAPTLLPPDQVEMAGTAGVLHDVGRIILAARLPDLAARVERERDPRVSNAIETELRIVGASHAQIGAYLMGLWTLPPPIVEALAFHHEPARVDVRGAGLATVVHVADALERERCDALQMDHLERLGLAGRVDGWRAERDRLRSTNAND